MNDVPKFCVAPFLRVRKAAIAAMVAVLLAGCGPKFQDGYVVTKEFRPSYRYMVPIMAGKVMVPTWHTAPDRWYVTIAKERFGNELETVEVTRETYESAKFGKMIHLN